MLCASNTTITCLYSTQWAQIVTERREYLTLCSLFSEAELPSHEYHRFRLVPCSDIDPVPEDAPCLAQQKGSDPPLQLQGWWLQIVGVHTCCFHPGSCIAASNHSGTNSTKLTYFTIQGATEEIIQVAYYTLYSFTSQSQLFEDPGSTFLSDLSYL